MVSDVDRPAEAVVNRILHERRPGDGVLGEEGTTREGSTGVRWVVDPLDGNTNFLFGIPQFGLIAAEVGRQTAVGVVADPSRGDTGPRSGAGGLVQRNPVPGCLASVDPPYRPGGDRLWLPVGPP